MAYSFCDHICGRYIYYSNDVLCVSIPLAFWHIFHTSCYYSTYKCSYMAISHINIGLG